MKVAVFRAEADGHRTARRLAELGHEAVLAPVIAIVPTGAVVAARQVDALVFTSQHALTAIGALKDLRRDLPCFCVGARTASAARGAGFVDIHVGGGDAAALAAEIAHACVPKSRIAFVAGRDRKADLEDRLARLGHTVVVTEAYDAQSVASWPNGISGKLTDCQGALHYSARSAALAVACAARSGLGTLFGEWRHFCLSPDVAASLMAQDIVSIRVAAEPTEEALFQLI